MLRLSVLFFLLTVLPASADVWTFETPSENIQCVVGEGLEGSDLTCTIIVRTGGPAQPKPSNCQSDWGHTFFMRDQGPVEIMCGPTSQSKDGFDRAEYGVTGEFGGFTCESSRKGLMCRNLDGHGFFLSRARQDVF